MKLFFRPAEHWSRDHIKISFSPIIPQGGIFTPRHAGWFGISVKKYVETYLLKSKILKFKDFRKFLGEWFSICETIHFHVDNKNDFYEGLAGFSLAEKMLLKILIIENQMFKKFDRRSYPRRFFRISAFCNLHITSHYLFIYFLGRIYLIGSHLYHRNCFHVGALSWIIMSVKNLSVIIMFKKVCVAVMNGTAKKFDVHLFWGSKLRIRPDCYVLCAKWTFVLFRKIWGGNINKFEVKFFWWVFKELTDNIWLHVSKELCCYWYLGLLNF